MKKNADSSQLMALYTDNHMEEVHRDQTGSFYTPYELARWMVWKALQLKGCSKSVLQRWELLTSFKVADIASGTGVFLIAWIDVLSELGMQAVRDGAITEEERLKGLALAATGVWAIDIHAEALETFRQLVRDRYGLGGVRTWSINALKDEFMENDEIGEILSAGGFDLILGNPPYIGEKGNRAIFDDIKDTNLYRQFYVAKMDYWYFFLHRAQSLLKPEGVLAYLVSSYFVTADGATKLRSEMQKMTLHTLVDFTDNSLFKAAKGHHSMAVFLSPIFSDGEAEIIQVSKMKGVKDTTFYQKLYEESEDFLGIKRGKKAQHLLYLDNGYMSLMEEEEEGVYKRLVSKCQWTLGELCHINQGIVSGLDSSREDGRGVFVLDEVVASSFVEHSETGPLRSFYKNSDIDAYYTAPTSNKRILYIDGLEENFERDHPEIVKHLEPHRVVLEKRRECQSGKRPWYALQWPRKNQVFEGPKLVVPHRASRNRFAFTDQPFHGSADIYYISVQKKILPLEANQVSMADALQGIQGIEGMDERTLLLYLMALLNSRVYNFLLVKSGKKKGSVLELYATPLKKLPIYLPAREEIVKIAEMANGALQARLEDQQETFQQMADRIENAVCKLYNITPVDRTLMEKVVKSWRKEDGVTASSN